MTGRGSQLPGCRPGFLARVSGLKAARLLLCRQLPSPRPATLWATLVASPRLRLLACRQGFPPLTAPTTPLLLAEATADEAAKSRAAKEGLLEAAAGGSQRAAPTAGGGKVRDPWSTFTKAKESALAFANFTTQAFADLEGDLSVSFYNSGIYIAFPPST